MLMAKTTTVVNLNGSIEIYDFEKAHWNALEHTGECIERHWHTHIDLEIYSTATAFFDFFRVISKKKLRVKYV